MRTRIQKWGDSLAVRIPESVAAEFGLSENVWIDLRSQSGHLEMVPLSGDASELQRLLALVTDDNLHREIDTGVSIGDEAW